MKKIVVFSGAGLDAESGIRTFRDSDGMWEEYNVMDVASISGWRKDRQLVLDFYNKRRKEFLSVHPNNVNVDFYDNTTHIKDVATNGIKTLIKTLKTL
jgi:NAD-dependent deacetylase